MTELLYSRKNVFTAQEEDERGNPKNYKAAEKIGQPYSRNEVPKDNSATKFCVQALIDTDFPPMDI